MDSSQEIRDRYAKEALTYRRDAWLVNFDSEKLFNEFKKIIIKLFDNKEEIKVLDIGAGNGMLTELILSCFPNAKITMLDFSSEMLESAKAIFEVNKINLENIDFCIKNFITDDFPNEKYDLIISSYALHHIRTLEELRNVYLKISKSLKDNGTFICLDYYLEENNDLRKKQVNDAFNKWVENFGSKEIAKEWANIIKSEDSPATLASIIYSIKECNMIPLLFPEKGILATIYGMTKLGLNKLNELQLIEYIDETKKYIDKEMLIDSYPFDIIN